MTVRPTLQLGDPELRDPVAPIAEADLADAHRTVADLADTLADWVRRTGYGRGIAAPQLGIRQRLVYLTLDRPVALVNSVIVARSAETWEPWDTCLSFSLSIFCRVRRSVWVDVEYQSLDGQRRQLRADGELGELLQHEIDHVDGVLAVDRITSLDTLCMRSEFERRHRDESPYRQ